MADDIVSRLLASAEPSVRHKVLADVVGQDPAGLDQPVVERVRLAPHRLEPRGVVDVGDRRDVRARHVELVDPEQPLFGLRHGDAPLWPDGRYQQHVGRGHLQLEQLRGTVGQHRLLISQKIRIVGKPQEQAGHIGFRSNLNRDTHRPPGCGYDMAAINLRNNHLGIQTTHGLVDALHQVDNIDHLVATGIGCPQRRLRIVNLAGDRRLAMAILRSGWEGEYYGRPPVHPVAGVGEVVVFCAALVGAGLGFLWFNTYPAQVFMGDVGALALGAALGVVAVVARQELVLLIMGGVFVAETLSVMLQVASFKLTGKRIFRMAPLHHHFELKGWPEPRVIVRFWIMTVILVLVGLASLKIR